MQATIYCPHCGHASDKDAVLCSYCGRTLESAATRGMENDFPLNPVSSILKQIRWGWIFKSIMIIIGLQLLAIGIMMIISGIFELPIGSSEGIPVWLVVFSLTFMFFLGSFITALLSPGNTILEPAIASAFFPFIATVVFVLMVSFIVRNVSYSLFTLLLPKVLIGWILPCLFGFSGARLGELLSHRFLGHRYFRHGRL